MPENAAADGDGDVGPGARRSDLLGVAAVAGAATLWALIGVFTRRLGAHGIGPADVAFWRAAGGGACFALHLAVTRRGRSWGRFVGDGAASHGAASDRAAWDRATSWRLAAFTVVGVFVFYRALPSAIAAGSIAVAYVLLYTAPIWVVAGVAVVRRRLDVGVVALAAVTAAGASLVVLGVEGGGPLRSAGVAWGLVAGASYASYYLVGQPLFARIGAITAYAIALPAGALLLAPFAELRGVDRSSALSIVGLVVISTWLPYALLGIGLRHLAADRAVIIATLEPVVAAAIGWSLYGERIAWYGIGGALSVMAAVVVANRRAPADAPILPREDDAEAASDPMTNGACT